MSLHVEVQREVDAGPEEPDIRSWAEAVLNSESSPAPANSEMTVRIVDEKEIAELNQRYRHKEGATNVLSFPCELPAEVQLSLLGDVVIAAPVVQQEAQQQGKLPQAHWAHMVVHGTLHLLGYDHIEQSDAQVMEAREISILKDLGYPNPY